ncbi:hypothetical protein F3Y22_tig00111566pilonHSYRG00169 [Hibiscus syriacus]|uniref:Uncharacterized protein n=1 Tax=Hibiscus syriacus TaxID=106335 RepID=A0A6A2XN69_HIBSY|nr:hypothetical protein F3Y22_tig00111566pilonHSYRG00169 [Hibiscus syriacus]
MVSNRWGTFDDCRRWWPMATKLHQEINDISIYWLKLFLYGALWDSGMTEDTGRAPGPNEPNGKTLWTLRHYLRDGTTAMCFWVRPYGPEGTPFRWAPTLRLGLKGLNECNYRHLRILNQSCLGAALCTAKFFKKLIMYSVTTSLAEMLNPKNKWIHLTSFLWDLDARNMAYLKLPKRAHAYRSIMPSVSFLSKGPFGLRMLTEGLKCRDQFSLTKLWRQLEQSFCCDLSSWKRLKLARKQNSVPRPGS